MQLNLQERKLALANSLEAEYADKPEKWWKGSLRFETTAIAAMRSKWIFTGNDISIFKYNFRKKWNEIVLGLSMITVILLLGFWGKAVFSYELWIFIFLLLLLITYPIFKKQNRLPKIILTDKGIWIEPLDYTISWEYVAASYIKHDNRGEDAESYLVLHYYEADKDAFSVAEYLLDHINLKPKDLAAEIEYRITKKEFSITK